MEQQGGSYNRKSRWPTLDELRPKLKEASLMESALEDNSEQLMSPKKMISASTSPLTSKGENFGGTPPSASYKPRMMRGEFRIWSKSIFHRLRCRLNRSTLMFLINVIQWSYRELKNKREGTHCQMTCQMETDENDEIC